MSAIYKRELKAYFSSPLGFIVVAFLMCIVGFYFSAYNLTNQYPWFGVGLYNTTFVLMIIVPVITMRIMAEERKQKTDQLLYTAPVKIIDIVLGKYLSVVTVFAIPMLIFCFYPLLLLSFGKNPDSMAMDYVTILGYFMLGAACLSVGFFISTITESQVLAAVLTFALLLLSNYSTAIASLIPATSTASLIGLSVAVLILAVVIYIMTKNMFLSFLSGLILEAAVMIVFLIDSTLLEGLINKVIGILDMAGRMANLVYGELDFTVIAYYLSVIVLFIFLSVQAIYKRRWS